MIDWNKLIENGKKCGIEYHFYDDVKLNACSCGGKARMYSKEHKEKKFSFEHLGISCEECKKHISGVYDISGNPSDTYRPKDEVMENMINDWNNKNAKSVLECCKNNRNGIFDKCQIKGNYNWDMPGKRK